ncbi:MAG: thioesterase family protein [Saprospiraceae bacterium]|nr:thioesterase family protein [Saprospiraceae bacterium]
MEQEYRQPILLRWADLDPNNHVRHSVYYDWGASIRIAFFFDNGLTAKYLEEHHLGPVLFREEAVFRREIRYGDTLWIDLCTTQLRRDGSRFSFRHRILRGDGQLCATLTVDGAWIDTQMRKLAAPPEAAAQMLAGAPRAEIFRWLDDATPTNP